MIHPGETGIDDIDDPSLGDGVRWRQLAQRLHEPGQRAELTVDIVYAVADAEGVRPRNVLAPPLYETVDVVGIEKTLFRLSRDGAARHGTGAIEFNYRDYLVKVRSDGWIQIYEPFERAQI